MAAFSIDDAYEIMRSIPYSEDAILVGGQALNFWASKYAGEDPSIEKYAPFTSADVDFLGGIEPAQSLADMLHGEMYIPSMDDHSPETAKVVLQLPGKQKMEIDFLAMLSGLDESHVKRMAASIRIPDSDKEFYVIHPFHCLKGQLSNVYGPLKRHDAHRVARVKLAVDIVQKCLDETFNRDERSGYNLAEEIIALSMLETAKVAFVMDGIDVLKAISDHPKQSLDFKDTRLPQVRAMVAKKRANYKKALDRQEARRALAGQEVRNP